MSLPPGPSSNPIVQAIAFGTDPYGFLQRNHAEYGEVFTIRLPRMQPCIAVSDPEVVKEMLGMKPDEFRCDELPLPVSVGEHSLLFQDGQRHLEQRRVLTPPLHGAALRSYGDQILAAVDELTARWKPGERFRFYPQMQTLALDVLLRCVFGASGATQQELRRLVLRWAKVALSPWLIVASLGMSGSRLRWMLDGFARTSLARRGGIDLRPWRVLGDRKAELVEFLRQYVATFPGGGKDVLSMLLQARYDDGRPLPRDEIVDQLVTMLVGGHETTAHALCWAVHHLYRTPRVLARAREEARRAGDDAAALADNAYLDACVRESMRLTPVLPIVGRTLTRPRTVHGFEIPASHTLWADVYAAHHRPDIWENPECFDPDRLLDTAAAPHVFLPFGGGRRRCLGAAFASYEMRIVLGRLVHFDLEVPTRTRARFRGFSISPADDLPVEVRATAS